MSADAAALRRSFGAAQRDMRKAGTRGGLSALPWFMVLGAPGAGTTTLLASCGLTVPRRAPAEQTRPERATWTWWRAEDAVLIDMPGRFVTDPGGWRAALRLLASRRPAQPLNGVVVAVSVTDLTGPPAERERLGEALGQRLAEAEVALCARVPVYIVLTQADRIAGFAEFFDGLANADRDAVLGLTFDLDAHDAAAAFGSEFARLIASLQSRMLERLQQEMDPERRGPIFRFPATVAALGEPLAQFLSTLGTARPPADAPFVRGIYLTAAAPADSLTAGRTASARGSVVTRLFRDVVFAEAGLVTRDRRLIRRRRRIVQASAGFAGGVLALALAGFAAVFIRHAVALDAAQDRIAAYRTLAAGIPTQQVADADFLRILPALDALGPVHEPSAHGLGVGADVERAHAGAYRRALNALLLPRLLVAARTVLQSADAEPRATFEALKLYLMLGTLGPLDAASVAGQAAEMFAALYPGARREAARQRLAAHVDALVAAPLVTVALDGALIASARARIAGRTVAERAYDLLENSAAARALPAWRPSAVLASSGEEAFARTSIGSLRDGIAGLYTADGLRTVVLPGLPGAAEAALAEDWVRGTASDPALTAADVAQDAARIHFDGFRAEWRATLADLRVRRATTPAEARDIAAALAAGTAPVERLANAIAVATDLTGEAADAAATRAAWAASPLDAVDAPDPYADLRRVVRPAGDGTASAIGAIKAPLEAIAAQLSQAIAPGADVAAGFRPDGALAKANAELAAAAGGLPAPLRGWIGGFSANLDALALAAARGAVSGEWALTGAPECLAAIEGRYPFDRASQQDVSMADFKRIFGNGGVFETFFDDRLAAFVDTTASPWVWRGGLDDRDVGTGGFAKDALRQFENAQAIREAFFASGEEPALTFDVTPVALSDDADAVQMEIGSQRVTYFHGPVVGKSIIWPEPSGALQARVGFQPGGWVSGIARQGPWAPLRLIEAADVEELTDGTVRATFVARGHEATFDITATSVRSTLNLPALDDFHCPASL